MAISGDNLYVVWWGNGTGNLEVMFKASNDNGQTFGDKINLSNSTNGTSVEADVAASGNNVYVTYGDNKTGVATAYLRASTDNGQTFGPDVPLTDPLENPMAGAQTQEELEKLYKYELKVVASGNNVYVTWWDKVDGKDQPMMRISHDGGQTFGEAVF